MVKMSLKRMSLFVLLAGLVIGSIAISGCTQSEVDTSPAQGTLTRIIEDITAEAAFDLIQENRDNPDFVILDVRTAEEYDDGHIDNAINIDFYAATFRDDVNKLAKDKTYLIYCRSGNRSGQALDIMDELAFQKVYNLSGGIGAWNKAGLPTTTE